jgi:DNA-binding GntR family transcriptional regulator
MSQQNLDRDESASTERPSERAIGFIRASMRDGRLTPGERVIEREIARELGIGRGSIREGIQVLIAQGYLVRSRQRSPRVKVWSLDEMMDFLEVWAAVGPLLLRLAAERIRIRDNAERVRVALQRAREAWNQRHTDPHSHLKAFGLYIGVLLDVAGNPVLRRACDSLNLELYAGSLAHVSDRRTDEYLSCMQTVETALFESTPDMVEVEYRNFVAFLTRWLRADYHPEDPAEG